MNTIISTLKSHLILTALACFGVLIVGLVYNSRVQADDSRLITIFVDGQEMVVQSDAPTVKEVLERAEVPVYEHDLVEPLPSEPITSDNFNINVYRGRPVTVIDTDDRYTIVSPHQSPRSMAESAGITVYPEDRFDLERIDNFVNEGTVGLKLIIDRATPVTLNLYGTPTIIRTQETTVAGVLKEHNLQLGENDVLAPAADTAISENMTIAMVRTGKEVVAAEEVIPFTEEVTYDTGRPAGERVVQVTGVNGTRLATYEILYENGIEVGRSQINAVIVTPPQNQVVILGTQFSGGVWAQLRQCEAGGIYTRNSGNGYYGAYQFSPGTWRGIAPSPYNTMLPHEAPPHIQDQAAQALQERSGWGQWPACAKKLGLY